METATKDAGMAQTDEKYVRPGNAWGLLKVAQKTGQTVYVYGSAGSGKTAFVSACLSGWGPVSWIDMETGLRTDELKNIAAAAANGEEDGKGRGRRAVVVDSLQYVWENEQRKMLEPFLKELAERPDIWLILISRSPVPLWLNPLYVRQAFMLIGEEDLALTETEQRHLMAKWGVTLSRTAWGYLQSLNCSQPVPLRIAAMRLAKLPRRDAAGPSRKEDLEQEAIEQARRDLWDYLDTRVYGQWSLEMQEFLMDISILDEFTLPMARQITRKQNAEKIVQQALETGNFLQEVKTEGEPLFILRSALKQSMRRRLTRCCSEEHIKKLYDYAGSEYEMQGELVRALGMYEKCGNEDGISRILNANASNYVGCGYYWEFRKYYLSLSETAVENSPDLMASLSLLQSILMNDEESERWYRKLKEYGKKHSGRARQAADEKLFFLDVSLPQRDVAKTPELLRKIGMMMTAGKAVLPLVSLTNNQPSIMNGGKDFCEWSRHDVQLAAGIGKITEMVLGEFGKGLVAIALAESQFEKGEDDDKVAALVGKGWVQAAGGGKTENLFSAVAILCRLFILKHQPDDALDTLDSFAAKAEKEAPQLMPNIETFRLRLMMYEGAADEAERWLSTAPDETRDFCTLERYRYMHKARVLLLLGKQEKAALLLQEMIQYGEKRNRVYLVMEAQILLAVTQHRRKDPRWRDTLQKAVTRAESYHFVRILTMEGAAVWELLRTGEIAFNDTAYRDQVMKECGKMAEMYPAFLAGRQTDGVVLSDKALEILQLQSEGRSVAQIAERLYLSQAGVKYYNQETYRKLGVNSKAAAISEAKNRGLI
ncbi:MAG: LuxR C-terminal-related transcriptional regulator [Lachnospiraceae bacterium]|jgi:LuxR family maltose regulon positive regulatory protein|nr:LuxR C-terminal-related transcriptional regulator [Lachnospiraceae bacterium]